MIFLVAHFFYKLVLYRVCHVTVVHTTFLILNIISFILGIPFLDSSGNSSHISSTISYTFLYGFGKLSAFKFIAKLIKNNKKKII